jgi:hypothetical protein
MQAAVAGESSDGFIKAQLPEAIAEINGFKVTKYGKFQLPIIKATPRGSYLIKLVHGLKMMGGSAWTSFM